MRFQPLDYDSEDELEVLARATREIEEALTDDLNTPKALSAISEVVSAFDSGVSQNSLESFEGFLKLIDDTTGLRLVESTKALTEKQQNLIAGRQEARDNKNFEEADNLRQELLEQGLELKDTPHGIIWRSKL